MASLRRTDTLSLPPRFVLTPIDGWSTPNSPVHLATKYLSDRLVLAIQRTSLDLP